MTQVCHVGLRLYRSTVALSTPRAWQGCVLSTSLEEVHVHENRAGKYYWFVWFFQRLVPLVMNNI